MNKIIIAMLSLIVASQIAGADGAPSLSDETKTLLLEAKSQTSAISSEQLSSMLDEHKIVLIDVRDPDEWEKKSIPYDRQVKLSRGFLEIKYPMLILDKYTKDDTFVVYCAVGPRSIFAAQRLQQLGFKHVYYLQDGIKAFSIKMSSIVM